MIVYFLTGGLFAMAIRSELLLLTYHLIGPQQYLMVVGEHGTMMMMMMSSVILGTVRPVLRPVADRVEAGRRSRDWRRSGSGLFRAPTILLSAVLMGGFSNRMDRLRAAGHPGDAGRGR